MDEHGSSREGLPVLGRRRSGSWWRLVSLAPCEERPSSLLGYKTER